MEGHFSSPRRGPLHRPTPFPNNKPEAFSCRAFLTRSRLVSACTKLDSSSTVIQITVPSLTSLIDLETYNQKTEQEPWAHSLTRWRPSPTRRVCRVVTHMLRGRTDCV